MALLCVLSAERTGAPPSTRRLCAAKVGSGKRRPLYQRFSFTRPHDFLKSAIYHNVALLALC
jgi:hypothetical protein